MNPPESELIELVRGMHVALQTYDGDKAANDAKGIAQRIHDDRPLWKPVSVDFIEQILQDIKRNEVPPYVQPEEIFPVKELFAFEPLEDLNENTMLSPQVELVAIHHAQGGLGSKGSYIIALKLPGDAACKLVVCKESHLGSPSEVFASEVMRGMGLRAPKFLVLSRDQFKSFTWKLRAARVTVPDTCGALHSEAAQEMGGMLMEFLPGVPLPECQPKCFDGNDVLLRDLARCMAVDIVINCLDRTPIIWNHEGNATNLLVGKDRLSIIDNTYNRIADEAFQQRHFDKIKACVEEMTRETVQGNKYMQDVNDFLLKSTGNRVFLRDEQQLVVVREFNKCNEELKLRGKQVIEQSRASTKKKFELAWGWDKREPIGDALQIDFCLKNIEML